MVKHLDVLAIAEEGAAAATAETSVRGARAVRASICGNDMVMYEQAIVLASDDCVRWSIPGVRAANRKHCIGSPKSAASRVSEPRTHGGSAGLSGASRD